VHVALLRGINVGGKNKLPMKDLVALFEAAGCTDVRTYIQSGNVVYRAGGKLAAQVPALLAAAIEQRLRLRVPLVTRSAREMQAVAANNPFVARGVSTKTLHVAFLAAAPSRAALAALDPRRSPPDELIARGKELYLACPNGMARTKLTNAYLDSTLATVSTMRNWNTVLALTALCEG